MSRKMLSRRLDVFVLHAHIGSKPPDYEALFRGLARLPAQDRSIVDDDRLVALPRLTVTDRRVQVVALEGPVGITPVVYNLEHQIERAQPLQPGDVLVNRTHALFDLNSRRVVVEFNQRGAKARDLAMALQHSGRRLEGFKTLQVSLTPVIGDDFADALEEFERIRSARVRLRRPNYDWDDWVDPLTDAASESDASAANVEFTAARNGSLSKSAGVIHFLKRATRRSAPSPIESASIVGRRPEDDADITISTRGFTVRRKVAIRRGFDGQPRDADVFDVLEEYQEELGRDPGDSDA